MDVFQAAKDLVNEGLEMSVGQGLSAGEKETKLVGILMNNVGGVVDIEIVGIPLWARALPWCKKGYCGVAMVGCLRHTFE